MKKELEKILENLSEVEYDLKCFMNVLNDYKEYCYLEDNSEWEKRFIVFIKIVNSLYNDVQESLTPLDKLIKTIPEKGE